MQPTNNKQFNDLEKAVLQWLSNHYKDENLTAQINSAELKERKWTKVGFNIDLDIKTDAAPVDVDNLKNREPLQNKKSVRRGWPLGGPEIKSDEIEDGGGSLLWGKGGRITSLEFYAYGHSFGENIKNFELSKSG